MKLNPNMLLLSCCVAFFPLVAQNAVAAENVVEEVSAVDEYKTELAGLKKLIFSANAVLQGMKDTDSLEMLKELRAEFALLNLKKEAARRRGISLEARAKEYYNGWLDQIEGIENKDMRKKAMKRYETVLSEYTKFVGLTEKGRKAFVPYVSDVQDIIIYLDADPSTKALKSLSNTIWKLDTRSKALLKQITGITRQLDIAKAAIPKKD
jgi:hypothetical protein